MSRSYKLFQVVCDDSDADDFKTAKTEWAVRSFTPEAGQTCVCGKKDITYCYEIWNRKTNKTLYPIGSKCIKKFKEDTMTQQMDVLRLSEARRVRAEKAEAKLAKIEEERQKRLEAEELRDLLAYADERDRLRMDALRSQIMQGGKYRTFSFAKICRMDAGYVHYLRKHGYEQEYLEIVEYWDLCAKHA